MENLNLGYRLRLLLTLLPRFLPLLLIILFRQLKLPLHLIRPAVKRTILILLAENVLSLYEQDDSPNSPY